MTSLDWIVFYVYILYICSSLLIDYNRIFRIVVSLIFITYCLIRLISFRKQK